MGSSSRRPDDHEQGFEACQPGLRSPCNVTVQTKKGEVTLAVQFSYDDGLTWQPAELKRSRDGWSAKVTHPAGTGHVSLRAQATDGRGATVQQTIIRAYHFG